MKQYDSRVLKEGRNFYLCAKKRFSAKILDSFYELSSSSTQALSTQFLPRPDRKESNLTFPADWRTKVHSCEKKKFLAKRLDFSYERSSYSGTFSCNGSDTGSATETAGNKCLWPDMTTIQWVIL